MAEDAAQSNVAGSAAGLDASQGEGLLKALEGFYEKVRAAVRSRICPDGERRPSAALLDRYQMEAHALAVMATELEAARQMVEYSGRASGQLEGRLVRAFLSQVAHHFVSDLCLSQGEKLPVEELGISHEECETFRKQAVVADFLSAGATAGDFHEITRLIQDRDGQAGDFALDDETLVMIRNQFAKFADDRVAPLAPSIHDGDELVPLELIEEMGELGVFGLTVPEEYGGAGLGKLAMCVVTEELSRGYIGVGSLGTRTEIAAELIRLGGTDEQRREYLPKLASGEIIPTAVFTEPDHGSDLAHLKTRAVRSGKLYKISGQKTWITHAARADLMTLLARTNPDDPGYGGLSMFLATKPRGTVEEPFPVEGLEGDEIPVLGYRGMKEYALGFEAFEVPASALLGGQEGHGFKQLMVTFESARIQTAARAVGVAQAAFDQGYQYATERVQFGRPIIAFPRVWYKIAQMAVAIMASRQITYFSARQKDSGKRCDLEAGMAKLLATKVAWEAADLAMQIHGGNGYACEYPISRILVDSRVLSIFEGASEIQAQVIARRILEE